MIDLVRVIVVGQALRLPSYCDWQAMRLSYNFFAIPRPKTRIKNRMSRIRLLPETVASQVAAGEVVERPASVVKELIENSIDAGGRKIDILIRRGGISLVRVVDDGCGMDRDDALLSLERHATSKIRSAADLQAVATLGFRGEALPSIASVSRFRLTTREAGAVAGTEIVVNGGKIDIVRDGGEAPGTQVEVRSLFYTCLRAENFFALKTRKAVTLNTRFICRRSVIPGSVFLCYETTACYSRCRRRRHWAIESETYMVSSYWSALLK